MGESPRRAKLLAVPLALTVLAAIASAWALLFVAMVCFLYAIGLGVGEVGLIMGTLPQTAGKILFQVTFPAQMFVMGLFILLLVVGAFQIVIGPLPGGRFVFLRTDGLRTLVGRLAALLAIVAGLELCKTIVAGAIVAPDGFMEFFARGNATPLTDPTGLALLASATILGALIVVMLSGKKP